MQISLGGLSAGECPGSPGCPGFFEMVGCNTGDAAVDAVCQQNIAAAMAGKAAGQAASSASGDSADAAYLALVRAGMTTGAGETSSTPSAGYHYVPNTSTNWTGIALVGAAIFVAVMMSK